MRYKHPFKIVKITINGILQYRIKTGNGYVMATFPTRAAAVKAAVEMVARGEI